jgi:hypothetical protein
MLSLLVGLVVLQAQATTSAEALKVTAPIAVADLDMGKLKGEPFRLAWSPDATEFYLQTAERDGRSVVTKARHYLVARSGGSPKEIESEPLWAVKYWTWKSWKASPGAPGWEIALDERREVIRATGAPRGGDVAGMGGDPSAGGTVSGGGPGGTGGTVAVGEGQNAVIRTMKLKGEVIGEWINAGIVPGLTFGWSPAALKMIAFSGKEKDVTIMDEQGRKQRIGTDKLTRLPAWSDDGKKLAFLEQKDRRKFVLQVVEVTPGS